MIDLRSDTVTQPTPGMLDAIVRARTGDDVFGEDPTVRELEENVSAMFGMEAGLFVPSGTMSNQLCLFILTNPGDEVIVEQTSHIFNAETAAAAHLSSIQLYPVLGERGKLTSSLVEASVRAGHDWEPFSKAVAVENTTNKGGGASYSKDELLSIRETANTNGLKVHLDGARIWNAMTITGIDPIFFGSVADTMSVCFSKGLGSPAGSMLLSSSERIKKARRFRKMWGGGMRQVGLLAAAAAYAIEFHYPLLDQDHRRAKVFAEAIDDIPGLSIRPEHVESNIVLFDVEKGSVEGLLKSLADNEIGMIRFGPKTIRATFHFQITDDDLDTAIRVLRRVI